MAVRREGHGAAFTHAKFSRVPKPGAVASVGLTAVAIEEKMNQAARIDIPNLAAAVRADKERAALQKPNAAHAIQAGGRCLSAVTAAESIDLRAVAGDAHARAI